MSILKFDEYHVQVLQFSLFALLNSMMKSLAPSYKNILNAHNYEALQCLNCESGVMRIHETLQRQSLEVLKKVVK